MEKKNVKKQGKVKRIVIGVVICGLITTNILCLGAVGVAAEDSVRAVEVMERHAEEAKVDKESLVSLYNELTDKAVKSFTAINKVIKGKTVTSLSDDELNLVLNELIELKKLAATRNNLDGLNVADIKNFEIYNGIIDICHAIEKFNVYIAYGLDYKSNSGIDNANEQLNEILEIMKNIDLYN